MATPRARCWLCLGYPLKPRESLGVGRQVGNSRTDTQVTSSVFNRDSVSELLFKLSPRRARSLFVFLSSALARRRSPTPCSSPRQIHEAAMPALKRTGPILPSFHPYTVSPRRRPVCSSPPCPLSALVSIRGCEPDPVGNGSRLLISDTSVPFLRPQVTGDSKPLLLVLARHVVIFFPSPASSDLRKIRLRVTMLPSFLPASLPPLNLTSTSTCLV